MMAADLVYPVLGALVAFVAAVAIPLLGFSLLGMIGKS